MERLLMLRLESFGCMAEAVLNGIPLGRTPSGGGTLSLPVHEYTMSGDNQVTLVIEPPPLLPGFDTAPPRPHLSDANAGAVLSLLLLRTGQPASDPQARTLARIDWVSPTAEVIEFPIQLPQNVHLPVNFPRWRWADTPVIVPTPELKPQITRFLQGLALALAQGNAEGLVSAARLRFEELALAYQRPPAEDLARFRAHIQQAHGEQPLKPELPTAQNLLLRPCAGGRMIECLGADGRPALRTSAGTAGPSSAGASPGPAPQRMWPLRVAMVENRLYVLR